MKKHIRSILEELESVYSAKDSKHVIESRAENIITSAINLIELMEAVYSQEEVEDLTRKFLNSIKHKDSLKFRRSLRRINDESK